MVRLLRILALVAITPLTPGFAQEVPAPRVRAVLFFSPSCPHCHTVITESLPPIAEKYGEALVIVTINTQSTEGQRMFREAGQLYGIPPEWLGVPLLAVGDRALIGSAQIPGQLPGIIEDGLAGGGIPWPEIDGLRAALLASGVEEAASEATVMDLAEAESATAGMTPWQRFDQDRAGNSVALLALVGMIISVLAVLFVVVRRASLPRWPGWIVALIIIAGLVVAAYLSYVEVTRSQAICGPVGDCNTVQQSPYARLFGLLPIGVLGLFGYTLLGLGWLLRDRTPLPWAAVLAFELWLLALFGTLFSIYLTVLEPFVIGATCMWCVTSAVLMTLLLWAATPAAVEAWSGPDALAGGGRLTSGR